MSAFEDIFKDAVKEAVYEYAKKEIIKAIVTKLPFLGGAFFNPIVAFFVGKILDIVFAHVWRAISFALTDLEVRLQKEAYDKATQKLKEAIDKSGVTEDEINKAKEEFKKAFRDLVHFPIVK